MSLNLINFSIFSYRGKLLWYCSSWQSREYQHFINEKPRGM